MTDAGSSAGDSDRTPRKPLWERVGLGGDSTKRVRRADTELHHTGGLVLASDFAALVAVAIYEATTNDSIFEHSAESVTLCRIGVVLVLLRMAALIHMLRVLPRLSGLLQLFGGGGTSEEKRQTRNDNADKFDKAARAAFDSRIAYWGTISAGLLGYSVLVTVTGGPFTSPLAPLMLAGFFLGQVRATSKENINILLVAGVATVLLSWAIEAAGPNWWFVHVKSGLSYAGSTYLPAAAVVAAATTVVNRATFIPESDEPGAAPAATRAQTPEDPAAPAEPADLELDVNDEAQGTPDDLGGSAGTATQSA